MITVPDLVKKTDKFFMGNPGKVDAELTKKQKVRNSPRILSFLEKYLYIKEHYADGTFITSGGSIDPEFRAIYLDFYTIVVGIHVTQAFIDEYFEILKDSKTWKSGWNWRKKYYDIAKRLEPYSKGNFQLSFISKLLHTVDNTFPIYDKNVRKVLGLPCNTGSTYSGKEANGETILEQLKEKYADLQIDRDFNILVNKVTCWSGVKISFVKKCDFIFWVMGK